MDHVQSANPNVHWWINRADRRKRMKGILQNDCFEWIDPVYKLVPENYADSFSQGSMHIGNLHDFANHEDATRSDSCENTIIRDLNGLDSLDPINRRFMEKAGFGFQEGGRLTVRDLTISTQGPNFYCICYSKTVDDFCNRNGAVFKISNPLQVALRLREKNRCLREFWLGPVRYRNLRIGVDEGEVDHSPMQKDTSFAHENEVRTLWVARWPTCPLTFDTKPDYFLARLVERIR